MRINRSNRRAGVWGTVFLCLGISASLRANIVVGNGSSMSVTTDAEVVDNSTSPATPVAQGANPGESSNPFTTPMEVFPPISSVVSYNGDFGTASVPSAAYSISPTSVTVSGSYSASAQSTVGTYITESVAQLAGFTLLFTVDQRESFSATTTFTSTTNAGSTITLDDQTEPSTLFSHNADGTFNDSGELLPGHSYKLNIDGGAAAFYTGSSSASYSFTLQVPEPASLSLLGFGSFGLLARRRRA